MYIDNLLTHVLGSMLLITICIILAVQALVKKRIFLKTGESISLNEMSIFKKLKYSIFGVLILACCIIMILASTPYIKDYPTYRNKEFQVIDHSVVEDVKHVESIKRSSSFDAVTIDGVDYKAEINTPIQKGNTVKISYLPNTKIIVDFEIY